MAMIKRKDSVVIKSYKETLFYFIFTRGKKPARTATSRPSNKFSILNMHKLFFQLYPLVWAVGFWFTLQFTMGTATPLAVVLSGSMEPQIHKGDLLIAVAPTDIREQDIVIYELPHRSDRIPIVHRVIKKIDENTFLTKG
jgi:signal peptidase I